VLKKRGNIDGEAVQRIMAAEANIENAVTMNNKRNVVKWCLQMQHVEKKEGKCVKIKLNHKLEAMAQGFHCRDLKVHIITFMKWDLPKTQKV